MNYKNAFRCKKCPESNNSEGCPVWMEITMKNVETGDVKIDKKCGFQFLPELMVEVIKSANRPAEEISAMRGEHIQMAQEASARILKVLDKQGRLQNS